MFFGPSHRYPEKGRLFFMHIPKTGGTAIEDAAQRSGFAWGRFDRHFDGVNGDGAVGMNKLSASCFLCCSWGLGTHGRFNNTAPLGG